MSINGFPIQILLCKSKEEQAEVISRLLFTFVTHKLQEHLNFFIHFLNFSELFQYIFILVFMISQVQKIFIQSHFESMQSIVKKSTCSF